MILGEIGVLVSHISFALRLGPTKGEPFIGRFDDRFNAALGDETLVLLVALPAVALLVSATVLLDKKLAQSSALVSALLAIVVGIIPAIFLAVFLCGVTYPLATSAYALPIAAWMWRRCPWPPVRLLEALGAAGLASLWFFVDVAAAMQIQV